MQVVPRADGSEGQGPNIPAAARGLCGTAYRAYQRLFWAIDPY